MNVPLHGKISSKKFLFDDERMFEFIFKVYFPRLMAFARKFISDRNTTEDIIQEVFLKIWIKRKEIKEDTFQTYLFTLVRNACLNHIKHQKIVAAHRIEIEESTKTEGLYYADFFDNPFHQTIFNEIQDEIEKIMQDLPEQTQKIFRLSRFEGMKNLEIAKRLKVSVRTVEKHNTKALARLKSHFSSNFIYVIAFLDLIKELNKHFF